ncbi:MAG TPA: gamma-glutamyltransferase [Gemmatimonadales bacterium]|nr:gamma-glutamyltransferase [Gemmatimonadales bacterium]
MRRFLSFALLGLTLLQACARRLPAPASAARAGGINAAWPYLGQARVTRGTSAMVVSGSPIASEVGRDILRAGGNAVDAAVAVGFALAVVHPEAGNIGGGGFMLIRLADGATTALDYRETAPGHATRNMFQNRQGEPTLLSTKGHLSVGVPGSVAGLLEALHRYGRLPLTQVIAPAIHLAEDGFVVDEHRSRSLDAYRGWFYTYPSTRRYFLNSEGLTPPAGSLWVQHDLARTLTAIRDRGVDGFYGGWVADSIVAEMHRGGGIITRTDLAGYRPVWRDPIRISYRGDTVYSMPPSSSGGVTLALILNIMEGFGPLPEFGTPALLHREAEAMRRAFTDRNEFLGDPAFVKMPLERLLSKQYAASLRGQINLSRATPTPPFNPELRDGNSTTHYSVVDSAGNAVSCTTTLNDSYGSAVAVGGAGFLLNDEMDDFATAPGKPNLYGLVQGEANAIQPGKRMLSAMTPSLVVDSTGKLFLVVGTPGGPTIITQVYHVISNVIDHRMALADAVAAPRLHHQGLPDAIRLERDGFQAATIDTLQAMGHKIEFRPHWGDVEAIIRTSQGWEGVSDPRGGGGGAGY